MSQDIDLRIVVNEIKRVSFQRNKKVKRNKKRQRKKEEKNLQKMKKNENSNKKMIFKSLRYFLNTLQKQFLNSLTFFAQQFFIFLIFIQMIQSLDSYKFFQQLTHIRRTIHKNPQIGLQEYQTSKFVRQYLKSIEGIKLYQKLQQLPTAVIAKIQVENQNQTFLFRCELDALPWKQQSGQQFSSINQLHHACGHDAHMASMLIAAKILASNKNLLKRSIIFCFQPGQQGKGGAFKLFKHYANIFQKVTYCFAIHFGNHKISGCALVSQGYVTANSNRFDIEIIGKGCHVMIPQKGIDANFVGCGLVSEIYNLKQRKLSPLQRGVVCVTKVSGGQSFASISQKFHISGTMRLFSSKSVQVMKKQLNNLTQKYCEMHQAKCITKFTQSKEFNKQDFYRGVFNDKKPTNLVKKTLNKILTSQYIEQQQPSFAGEDFCQFSERFPSCYIVLGSALDDSFDETGQSKYPLHSNRHRLNQKTMVLAVQIWKQLAFSESQ